MYIYCIRNVAGLLSVSTDKETLQGSFICGVSLASQVELFSAYKIGRGNIRITAVNSVTSVSWQV